MADEDMLHRALVNVLMNAVQATPPGGSITVTTRLLDDELLIEVADTGAGIPAGVLEHVFKPFFTTRHTGTGLGLSITREIVQRHGGSIRLESSAAAGTTVTLRLPLHALGITAALEEAPVG